MVKSIRDIVGMNCIKDLDGKIVIESDEINEVWRKYMEKLLNVTVTDNVSSTSTLTNYAKTLHSKRMTGAIHSAVASKGVLCHYQSVLYIGYQ